MTGHPALRNVNHRLTGHSVDGPCCHTCTHSYPDKFLVGLYGCTNRSAVGYTDKADEPLFPGGHLCDCYEPREEAR